MLKWQVAPSCLHRVEIQKKREKSLSCIPKRISSVSATKLSVNCEKMETVAEAAIGLVSTTVGLGLLAFVVAGFSIAAQPTWMVRWFQKWVPDVLYIKPTQERIVALTIDDGPHQGITEEILDILKENRCRSTFFIIGSNMDNSPDLVRRIVEEGHEVGNHTMYDVASWSLPLDAFEEQLLAVDHQLENYFFKDASQMPIKWFRPGHGFYTRRMVLIAQAHGYRTALGSLFPLDTLFTDLGKHIAKYMLWRVHPGAIIILHDREPQKTQTAEILRIFLPKLKACGYLVVTLSELLELC